MGRLAAGTGVESQLAVACRRFCLFPLGVILGYRDTVQSLASTVISCLSSRVPRSVLSGKREDLPSTSEHVHPLENDGNPKSPQHSPAGPHSLGVSRKVAVGRPSEIPLRERRVASPTLDVL